MQPEDHIIHAEHNKNFYQAIDQNAYSDWAMTVLFYSALHFVDAVLVKFSQQPGNHEVRDQKVKIVLRSVVKEYFRLKTGSINSRYHAHTFSEVELRSYEGDLAKVEVAAKQVVT